MKRNISILLVGMLLVGSICLSACGQGSSSASISASAPTKPGVEDGPAANDVGTPGADILEAQPFEPLIQVGGTVLTLPVAYSSFVAAGAENMDSEYNADYLVDAGAHHIVSFSIDDTQVTAYVHNDADERLPLKDCVIKSTYSTQGEGLFYPGGVYAGMALDELTAAWGEPTEDLSKSYEDVLTYSYAQYPYDYTRFGIFFTSFGGGTRLISATGNSYMVTISRSTSQIQKISRTFTEGVGSSTLFEESKAFTYMGSNETTLLCYSLPGNFYYNAFTLGGRRVSAIIVDGEVYVATIDIPNSSLSVPEGVDPATDLTNSISKIRSCEATVLQNENDTPYATGYFAEGEVLYAAGGFVAEGRCYMSYENCMIPLDPAGVITPQAQAAFEEFFNAFILSMYIKK